MYCRKKVGGLGGLDINICLPKSKVIDAPLYTEWLGEGMTEFRAHIFNGEVLVRQQKKRMGSEKLRLRNIRQPDPYVRVNHRGWVFAEHDIEWKRDLFDDMCIRAVDALGLTFGTVDFQCDMESLDAFVLEVNTAPGMENRNTFSKYCDALRRYK